jgi:hypothetical protein
MPQPRKKVEVQTVWLPRPAAKYPGCYPVGYENILPDLLGTTEYAHLFAGKSKTGFRVDTRAELSPDLIANCEDLSELATDSFPAVVADPPYTKEFAKTLYNQPLAAWTKWTKEAVRICKPGGRIAIMHNYVVPRLPGCKYSKILVIITRIKQYPKIVTIQEKEPR